MLRIIIADDEAGIIELCRALIDTPGASVIGEAHNGIELYELIGRLRPNAVITDIRMPGMTGLELIEKARTAYPEVNFIVMSGYTDFEYVQTALRSGVWDYLLKPLKKTELNGILKKLDQHLEGECAEHRKQEEVATRLDESLTLLRERYVREVWMNQTPVALWSMQEGKIFDLDGKRVQWAALCLDERFESQHAALHNSEEIRTAIARAAEELGIEAAFSLERDRIVGLLLYPQDQAQTLQEKLRAAIEKHVWIFNARSLFFHCACAVSRLHPATEEGIARAAAEARTALDWRLEFEEASLIAYDPSAARQSEQYVPFGRMDDLRQAVASANAAKSISILGLAWEGPELALPGSRARRLKELLECVNYALKTLPDAEDIDGSLQLTETECLSEGTGPARIASRMQLALRRVLERYQEFLNQRENNVITRARQYVQQHQSEDITLNDVAAHVHLSPAYFSTLFKQETGGGFIKYLQHVRVESAKALLRESDRNIRDIAEEVGYRDVKHFNKIFYNETNVTPSEYRKFYRR